MCVFIRYNVKVPTLLVRLSVSNKRHMTPGKVYYFCFIEEKMLKVEIEDGHEAS